MNGVRNGKIFWPRPLRRGQKVKYHLISVTMSISKIFLYQTLCVFSNERDGIFILSQGWDFGALEVPRGSKNIYFEHGHVAYQIYGDDEQNRMQVNFSCKGQTGDLGVRSKGQISVNFGYHVNLKNFDTKLCVCSRK